MLPARKRGILRENWVYLFVSSLLLFVGIMGGIQLEAILPLGVGGDGSGGLNPLLSQLQQLVQFYQPYTPLTALIILGKNTLSAALSFFSGFTFFIPGGVLLVNGVVLGYVGAGAAATRSLEFALGSLVPHGVVELTGLIFATAGGLRFGVAFWRKISSLVLHKVYSFKTEFFGALKLFIISLALLEVAAVLETYLTPYIMGL